MNYDLMNSKKGQMSFVAYAFTIAIATVILISITLLFYSIRSNIIADEVERELKQVALQVSDAIVKMHDVAKNLKAAPLNASSILVSQTDLNLPERISDRSYELILVSQNQVIVRVTEVYYAGTRREVYNREIFGPKIIARTTEDPIREVEISVPSVGVDIQGISDGRTNTTLSYYRYNYNETIRNVVILGEPEMIVQIDSIV